MGAAGAVGMALRPRQARLLEAALASDQSAVGSLSDIEHIVILMQENRSFDHYFGTLSDVRGYGDPDAPDQIVDGAHHRVFDQFGPAGYSVGGDPYLQPFDLVSNFPTEDGQTTNDITHDWGPQHYSWNSGRMDQFLKAHLAVDGATNGFLTMGFFTRGDLPFYHSLADAFTICDGYHCSVLGPTDPNRLMSMTGSLGADGAQGGPVLETYTDPLPYFGSLDWMTFPEVLTEAGVSWKVYQDPSSPVLFNPLPFFKNFANPTTARDLQVVASGLLPQYPAEFVADVASGTLPSVSWIIPPAECCEHPAAPPEYGEWLVSQILATLVSSPDVWARTVFLVVYDENGGWFDHVPPPTPGPLALSADEVPSGDGFVGEYVTAPLPSSGYYTGDGQNMSVLGPMGLGFRTPCLVISPFSRGGYVCSETFDHVSTLKLISTRFGVPVPNASAWRLATVGDMTGALALALPPVASVPSLPPTSITNPAVAAQAVLDALTGTEDAAIVPYPAPSRNSGVPAQETTPARTRLPLCPAPPSSGGWGSSASAGGQGAEKGGRHGAHAVSRPAGPGPGGSAPNAAADAPTTSAPVDGSATVTTSGSRRPSRPARRAAARSAPDEVRRSSFDHPDEAGTTAAAVGGVSGAWLAAGAAARLASRRSRRPASAPASTPGVPAASEQDQA